MQFSAEHLTQVLLHNLTSSDPLTRAQAENVAWEQGVSGKRRDLFEEAAATTEVRDWLDFCVQHNEYFSLFVATDVDQPHTFADALQPNSIGEIDQDLQIIRLESLVRPLEFFAGYNFEDLKDAHDAKDNAFLQEFCSVWNLRRDNRPQFASLLSSVAEDLEQEDWPDILRDRMGLAHFTEDDPVALMAYPVSLVRSESKLNHPITMPTVLDSRPWPHYFPAPAAMRFGRAMALTPVVDDANLLVELLNAKVAYRPKHIMKIGRFKRLTNRADITQLREDHLNALRIASGDEAFGQ